MFDNDFYVYTYRDPEEEIPFYVGKGRGARARQHLYHTTKTSGANLYKVNKINQIRKRGLTPIIEYVAINLSEETALTMETQLIEQYGRKIEGGALTNMCPTGHGRRGLKHSDETKDKIRAANTGRKLTDEQRARIREGCKRRPKPSVEARAKMSKAKQQMSEETKDKLRQIALNRPAVSNTTRAKLAENVRGSKWYNNGVRNIRVFPNDSPPDDFVPGKIRTSSTDNAR